MSNFKLKNYAASFFIGTTTEGIDTAVFYDPNFANFNGIPPVCLITGSPGSGKTFFAQTVCAQSAQSGKMTVVIDPKADFISMKNLEKDLGKVNLIQLSSDSKPGVIDPYVICGEEKMQGITLAKEMIKSLTGMKEENLPLEAINPILKDVALGENPSFTKAVEKFNSYVRPNSPDMATKVRQIGSMLSSMREMPFANLIFSNPYKVPNRIPLKKGLTVFTMLGMDLPSADKPRSEYSESERLFCGIMFLVTDYVSRVMKEDSKGIPKVLIIDEAWAVVKNQSGAGTIRSIAKLGRSLNISLILATQDADDVSGMNIDNYVTTYFSFRANGEQGNKIAELMGIRDPKEEEPRDWKNRMSNLEPGECLMKDTRDRYSTVKISQYKTDWAYEFETNPIEKAERELARKQNKGQS